MRTKNELGPTILKDCCIKKIAHFTKNLEFHNHKNKTRINIWQIIILGMLGHDQIKVPFLEDNKACQTRQHNMKEKKCFIR
jgi:hypothetical protein